MHNKNQSLTQILQAIRNHQQPVVTYGARLRQALLHVHYSRNNKPANEAGLQCAVAARSTTEDCREQL